MSSEVEDVNIAKSANAVYVGFCPICDEDTVFVGESQYDFTCPKCQRQVRLPSNNPVFAQA
jgi:transcription initiation factor IIE alpha subunit